MTAVVVYPNAASIFAAACACIFIVVGILGNLITIIALLRCPKLRTHATTAFVLSLCISDLLFCTISLPLTAVRFINKAWTLGDTLCKVFPVIFYGNVAVSLLSMVGITLNRYVLIAYHSKYARIYQCHYIWLQLFFVWGIAFALMIMPLLEIWGQLGLDEATFSCTILNKEGSSPKKLFFLVGFILPSLVIIISYSCIYRKVKKQRRTLMRYNLPAMTVTEIKKNSSSREKEDARLTGMMLMIFLCFMICFLPLMVCNVVVDDHHFPWLHICSSVMAWASSVINPFIYAASNRNYRVAFCKFFAMLKFWDKNAMSPYTSRSVGVSRGSRDVTGNGAPRNTSNDLLKPSPLDSIKIDLPWLSDGTQKRDTTSTENIIRTTGMLKFAVTSREIPPKEDTITNGILKSTTPSAEVSRASTASPSGSRKLSDTPSMDVEASPLKPEITPHSSSQQLNDDHNSDDFQTNFQADNATNEEALSLC